VLESHLYVRGRDGKRLSVQNALASH
jgi:hypothetical protein